MAATHKPNEAAQLIGVSVHSIRRWCNEHSAALSAAASPQPGAPRQLDDRDLEVLRMVRDLRAQGMTTLAINDRLAETTFATVDSVELAPAAQKLPDSPETALMILDALERITSPLAARVDALESQHLKIDIVWIAVACFIAGLLLGLAMWWFK